MKPVNTFTIRKCSKLESGGSWRHFPQRSSLTLHIVVERDGGGVVMIYWKGDALMKLYWNKRSCLSFNASYPSLAVKQVSARGNVNQRIQVDFRHIAEFEKCCDAIKRLDLPLKFSERQSAPEGASQGPSQAVDILDSQMWPLFSCSQPRGQDIHSEFNDYTQSNNTSNFSQGLTFASTQNTSVPDTSTTIHDKGTAVYGDILEPAYDPSSVNEFLPVNNVHFDLSMSDSEFKAELLKKLKQKPFLQLLKKVEATMIDDQEH
ncbi:predicted protein [Meyerozyma guilliermondii ATCC 6260]|uniref:Uncharacterized protein n=1 Tax=Meyerozyma guilliermondii (strain ATCC 6260 / CBS 566 / DSM 6381 / JCM 1539 / NBRC 10279 / NRRL Y-324) TaxID=294746 RepID=A5DG16_PICGU|nr:uncharacterized protein PGUG_02217 [Meyerozyma guilliermondii ATCC 6260]EDK38119.2 predicted protein [Meyerozyma guilliermondii ATCC 6260]